ncbi:response regulator [bacterium]|nr:MAG: response regulator [bacterium]
MSNSESILIVEDDELILKTLEFRLKKENYKISIAKNGLEAKKILLENPPKLMITDLMLPFINGRELIQIAKNECNPPIKVIVLSASSQENVILDAFKIGADDFVSKPFSPIELSIRVKRFLSV